MLRDTATRGGVRAARPAVLLVLAVLATGFGVAPAAAVEPAPDRGTARFEVDFLTRMIDHHAMAVEMAMMCVGDAKHEQLRDMCDDIMESQSAQIEDMQTWLRDWYDVSYEPQMRPGEMRRMERLASLSGPEFEIAFMESMMKHHRAAIREAQRCLRRASHPELRDLCEDIIEAQTAEIAQMRQWLCKWYDRCRGRQEAA